MIRWFRKRMCKLLSWHEMEFEMNTHSFELSRCKYCGLRSAISHDRRDVRLMGRP